MTPEQVRSVMSHGTRTAKVATVMEDGQPHVMPVWFVFDGQPHVMPVWFVFDEQQIVFTTGANTVKGGNLQRDPRIALVVEDDEPPFAFVHAAARADSEGAVAAPLCLLNGHFPPRGRAPRLARKARNTDFRVVSTRRGFQMRSK
jgi:hypothetical protein